MPHLNAVQREPLCADKVVYFADAVHPEYQVRPACGWIKKGSNTAIKTTSGRIRVNIHGALRLAPCEF